ncbi:MAG: hypothetical protein ACTSO9_11230 [Candidatus Helarchaeota archaeon]
MGNIDYEKMIDAFEKAAANIETIEIKKPSKKLKFFFWIILGFSSVFFAEVVSGSDMIPFFWFWGLCVVVPLYTLHILVLSHIVFKHGKPNIYTLFLSGMLFGMYEAYITKVLWSPFWNENAFKVGGIAIFEFFLLVFWWHAFFAFIIPLFISENLLTSSREIQNRQPERVQNLFNTKRKTYAIIIIFAIWCGGLQSINSLNPFYSILSGLSTTTVIGILVLVWRKKTNGRDYTIYELVPNQKEFYVLFSLLIIYYIITGIYLRPEAFPDIWGHFLIWLIYTTIFILLYFNLKRSKEEKPNKIIEPEINFSWKLFISLALIFTISSAMVRFIPPLSVVFFFIGVFLGVGIGIILFIGSIVKILKK